MPIEPWILDAAHRRVHAFSSMLRGGVLGAKAISNLDWSVSDLAQHVAGLPSYWREQHNAGSTFDRPTDFAAYSDEARAAITETDPAALADLIDTEFETFLLELAKSSEERWLYGRPTNPTNMCGLVLNELILHGRDLAAVTGDALPSFERNEANVAVNAMMVTVPCFIDETKALAQPDGIYDVRFRDGKSYTWTKTGGELTITEGTPAKPDARLRADPEMFLLSSLGRVSQIRAGMSGKMISYGKRPWRFLGLGSMAIDGV